LVAILPAVRLRIDELAQRAGTTSRNVRSYQARGLLPPPHLEGRTGYYDEGHLHRLELIGELQARGFSLAAIAQTLDTWSRGGDLSHLLGLRHILTTPLTDEEPAAFSLDDLVERFPDAADRPDLVERATALELIEPAGPDQYAAPSPVLIEAGTELARSGVPLEAILDLVEAVRPDVAAIADRFVDLVASHLVTPIAEGNPDPERVGETLAALARLRPIALEVVRPFLAQEMRRAIDRTAQEHGGLAGQGEGSTA
jgi:DNA-binding transcriptional MerR regulator